jgi:hypothetical protein
MSNDIVNDMEMDDLLKGNRKEITPDGEIDLNDLLKDTDQPGNDHPGSDQPKTEQSARDTDSISAADLINGKTATELLDVAAPVVLSRAAKAIGRKINKADLRATPEEKKIISPVMQRWLESIRINTRNPLNALLLVCAFIYGTKIIDVNNTGARSEAREQAENNDKKETRGRKAGSKKGVDFK